jgi:hypothetical protein
MKYIQAQLIGCKRNPEFLVNMSREGEKLMTNLQNKSGEFILVNQFYHQLYFEELKIQKLFGVSIEEEVKIIYYNLKQSDIGENNFCDETNWTFSSEFMLIL